MVACLRIVWGEFKREVGRPLSFITPGGDGSGLDQSIDSGGGELWDVDVF